MGELVIPDGIEPMLGYRAWHVAGTDGLLVSVMGNQTLWPAGEPLVAECNQGGIESARWRWVHMDYAQPGDLTAEDWYEGRREFKTDDLNSWAVSRFGMKRNLLPLDQLVSVPRPPKIILPFGLYVYALVIERHPVIPAPQCSCGIYAVAAWDGVPQGVVYGRIKAWGQIVPGTGGFRAQYAYPEVVAIDLQMTSRGGAGAGHVKSVIEKMEHNYGIPVLTGKNKFVAMEEVDKWVGEPGGTWKPPLPF